MNEIKKCSISGVAFTLDTDAYEALAGYLNSLKKSYKDSPDGQEIVADIEARIAELILSAQSNERVVEKPLILNIIQQLGSPEDITEEHTDSDLKQDTPRIPRRLYRDTENAKLGGVCAGIGKYFDIDPTWIRLSLFIPLAISCFGWLRFMHWSGPIMGNLFGVCVICYVIMWFAVPVARTARQKLEMNGDRITEESIRKTTESAANCDPDSRAKPIVAEAVSVFGKIVLILMKIIAGFFVFGLILTACALIIGLFAMIVGGEGLFAPELLGNTVSPLFASLGIFVALIPVILLIYVLMCLIASRKPGGKTVLVIFLLWILSIVGCSVVGIREGMPEKVRNRRHVVERAWKTEMIVDGDTTSLGKLFDEFNDMSIVNEDDQSVRISIPSKSIDITIDKRNESLIITGTDSEGEIQAGVEVTETTDGDSTSASVRVIKKNVKQVQK